MRSLRAPGRRPPEIISQNWQQGRPLGAGLVVLQGHEADETEACPDTDTPPQGGPFRLEATKHRGPRPSRAQSNCGDTLHMPQSEVPLGGHYQSLRPEAGVGD
jgi:hypothetical protein